MKSFHTYRGGEIAYETKGSGKAVVLIHGFLGNANLWNKYTPRLSKHYRLFIIDLPGHGASSTYGYLHGISFMANAILDILKAHKIRKAFVIGHSLGGYVALSFAEKNPDMTRGIMLINSTAKGDSAARKASRNQLKKLIIHDRDRTLKNLIPSLVADRKKCRHAIKSYYNMAAKASTTGIIATVEGMKTRNEREIVLRFAPYPYAYLIGEKDNILNADELLQEAALNPNGSALVVKEAGHLLPLEATEKTFAAIKKFLKQLKL